VFVVSYSRAFKWFIAALLPLTLVWKLTAAPDPSSELKDKLVAFLVHHQFDVVVLDERNDTMPLVVRATTGACRLLLMEIAPDGWQQDLVRDRAQATDRVFFIFRGQVYPDQPTWLTAAAGLWSRQLQRLGLRQYVTPVVAVIASELCSAEGLPWDELYERGVL
jgi:hypothetical protein